MKMAPVDDVQFWLKSNWGLTVPQDWLEACIEWIQADNRPNDVNELRTAVLEQWLISDLREIGVSCLPPDLVQHGKYSLTGSYCLQVNSVIDVGSPVYGQLQTLRGTENENAHVSADTPSQHTWNAKSGRMLMMELTDGSQDVRAMEYQPISSLNVTNLSPGCKILVHGNVLCRLGVLMLTSDNVTLLGGEVESLVNVNSQARLLSRVLGLNDQLTSGERPEGAVNNGQCEASNSNMANLSVRGSKVENCYHSVTSKPSEHINNNCDRNLNSELDFDYNDDDILAQLDVEKLCEYAKHEERDSASGLTSDTDETDMIGRETERNSFIQNDTSSVSSIANSNSLLFPVSSAVTMKRSSTNNSCIVDVDYDDDDDDNFQDSPVYKRLISKSINQSKDQRKSTNNISLSRIFPDKSELSESCSDTVKRKLVSNEQQNMSSSSSSCGIVSDRSLSMGNDSVRSESSHSHMMPTPPNERISNSPLTNKSRNEVTLSNSSSLLKCNQTTEVRTNSLIGTSNKQMKTSSLSTAVVNHSIELNTPPFTYLSKVIQMQPMSEICEVRVKAFISTLVNKLEHNNGTGWSLVAKINDGTAVLDVNIGDEVLMGLIGFRASELMQLREAAATDKAVKEKLTTGLKHCQTSLIQLSCILELRLDLNQNRPYVKKLISITASDLNALRARSVLI